MGKLYDMSNNSVDTDTDVLDIDYFTAQFNKKTQFDDFYEPKPEADRSDDIPSDLIDPEHEVGADERPGEGIWRPSEEERSCCASAVCCWRA